jgi:uncharacterized protein
VSNRFFTWHDLYTADPVRAQNFYKEFLGWRIETTDMGGTPYHVAYAGSKGIGGINGFMPGSPAIPHWANYIDVADVAAAESRITANGGSIVVPAFPIPGVGSIAYAKDQLGASFAIIEDDNLDAAPQWPPHNPGPGEVVWHDLMSSQVPESARFYANVIGWEARDWTDPKFACFGLTVGETTAAIVVERPRDEVPIEWTVYFEATGPIDDMIAQAIALGGKSFTGKINQPGFGDFSIIEDPTGGVFGIVKSEMWSDGAN